MLGYVRSIKTAARVDFVYQSVCLGIATHKHNNFVQSDIFHIRDEWFKLVHLAKGWSEREFVYFLSLRNSQLEVDAIWSSIQTCVGDVFLHCSWISFIRISWSIAVCCFHLLTRSACFPPIGGIVIPHHLHFFSLFSTPPLFFTCL